ncbi:MAG: YdeI/OmpD-associated family protein [Phycisphaerae bacterium]|nr:YdeI/OmpD-associated family protein [Phycisphaerae bacterium]
MKQLYVANRVKWREWLGRHYATESVIWLVFYKKGTSKPTIDYEAAVEEALCFGCIDSIIKKIDDEKYARKFTPRKDQSYWSELNKKRAVKMMREGRMTSAGLAKIEVAKKTGLWGQTGRPNISLDIPLKFARALDKNKKAKENFEKLAPSYRKHYIGWIQAAKRDEIKEKRTRESVFLLEKGERLGLK